MRYVVAALWTLLLVILVFSVQNRASVDVSFLLWSVSLPKVFLILGTYLLGMLSCWGLVGLIKRAFEDRPGPELWSQSPRKKGPQGGPRYL
jgi:uncharacterized integral membrane protein